MNGQSADSEIGRGAGQRPLRVLHVVDKLSTGGSPVHGLTRLLSWWLPLYDPRRVRASVGCLRGPQDGHATLACAGIAVRYLGRSKFDARTIPRLVRNLRSERIDILHLHGFGGSTIGRLVGWITGIPCIVHEHVCKAEIPTHQRLADRLLRSRTAAAIAASGAVADFLAEKRFIPPDAIQVVHGGVPARLFRAPAKRGWRRKLGVAEDCRIVATVGRLHAAKGHTHFLEAARQVLDAVERVVFLIVGDGELLDELRQQAASLDLEKHVLFTGHIDEIPSLLAEVDIVAISSTSEGGADHAVRGDGCRASDRGLISRRGARRTGGLGQRLYRSSWRCQDLSS